MCCVFDFSCAARLSGSEEEVEEYEEIEAVLHSEKKVVAIIQWNLSIMTCWDLPGGSYYRC